MDSKSMNDMPNVDDMFVSAVSATIELATMLGLSRDQFFLLIDQAWATVQERMSAGKLAQDRMIKEGTNQ